jgi:hypothetical protein
MEQNQSHNRAWYRINALRTMTGGTKLTTPLTEKSSEVGLTNSDQYQNYLIKEHKFKGGVNTDPYIVEVGSDA